MIADNLFWPSPNILSLVKVGVQHVIVVTSLALLVFTLNFKPTLLLAVLLSIGTHTMNNLTVQSQYDQDGSNKHNRK